MELIQIPDIPVLDIGRRIGHTEYIDFLKWDEVEYPVMKGIDVYKRHFIVVKMIVNGNKIMETYFQRQTNDVNFWMACGHATRGFLDTRGSELIKGQIELLKKVINGENVLIEKKHNTKYGDFIGDYVRLFDEKKENAAKIIQRNWRQCRYNPKYKMCEKIQYGKLVEICNS